MTKDNNWQKLQNGSDIRGVALEGIPGEDVNLDKIVVEVLGKAFVTWLLKRNITKNLTIAVGMDSRLSGPALKEALSKSMKTAGVKVFDCGLASTPAMFMTTIAENNPADAGIMITASHLPFNRNGLKFFTKEGGLGKEDISQILSIAKSNEFKSLQTNGSIVDRDFIDEYSANLVKFIRDNAGNDEPLKGLKIIVDAGNGAGGFFADKVLLPLGADTEGSQFLDPDGNFPNHVPNPEDKEAMQSICDRVKKEKADLGIIFDTDVDRSAIVDHYGNPVNRNALIALISAVILKEHPKSTIVTDSITSEGLTHFIENDLGGKHHRFKRGYKNVINESIRLNNEGHESWLAIETSGHAALKENYFLDDGAFLVAKLLVEMASLKRKGQQLTDLIQNLKQPVEDREFRFKISHSDFKAYGESVLKELKDIAKANPDWEIITPNYEGLRVRCNNNNEQGWFLLRMSLHDPVMPLNIESDVEGGVKEIAYSLRSVLNRFDDIDISCLDY